MMIPGRALHRLAARICRAKTIERVVEPAIADLQREYLDARAEPAWRRGWVLLAGYVAVSKVLVLSLAEPTLLSSDDRGALGRTLFAAGVLMVAFSGLLIAFPVARFPQFIRASHVAFLIPQALPLSIPLAVTLGIAYGFTGRSVSSRAVKIAIVLALVGSVASLGTTLWIMPTANQAFRQEMFIALGNEGTVMKGSTEMSLAELRLDVAAARARWDLQRAREGEWSYHIRWALPWATLVLVLFAFASGRRLTTWHGWMAMGTCVIYFVLLHLGEALVYRWNAPPFLGPWLPNGAFVLAGIALRRRA